LTGIAAIYEAPECECLKRKALVKEMHTGGQEELEAFFATPILSDSLQLLIKCMSMGISNIEDKKIALVLPLDIEKGGRHE
jgi:hypothetical protein